MARAPSLAGLIGAAALVLVMMMSAFASNTEIARAACNPGRSNNGITYVVGSGRATTLTGVQGTIENYSPYSPSFYHSAAWIQLVHTGPDSWVKFGWKKVNNGTPFHFSQSKTTSGTVIQRNHGSASGATDGYSITWQLGVAAVYLNGSYQTQYDTSTGSPDLAQAAGEIETASNQMPGGSSARVSLTNLQVRTGSWTSFSGTAFNSSPTRLGINGISTTAFDVWDTACTT